jgi:hypothetical protein
MWGWLHRLGSGLRAALRDRLGSWWPDLYGAPGRVRVRHFATITADPPPMHWAPCHPSTVKRFKASMTCPNGHGLTLRGHAIDKNGNVSPSVVCPVRGCSFHEFVRLDRWSFGAVP